MDSLEIRAKTVEEAIEEALKKLGVRKDNIEVDIINEPSGGFFGLIGQKDAVVKVTVKKTGEDYIKEFLTNLLSKINVSGSVEISRDEENNILAHIRGKNMGVLIGRRGQTLNAIQYLCSIAYHRQFKGSDSKIIVDVENYRSKRKKILEQLARNLAKKAIKTNKEVVLEPMNSMERRIIHMVLKNYAQVTTKSQGEEPFRKIVIIPK